MLREPQGGVLAVVTVAEVAPIPDACRAAAAVVGDVTILARPARSDPLAERRELPSRREAWTATTGLAAVVTRRCLYGPDLAALARACTGSSGGGVSGGGAHGGGGAAGDGAAGGVPRSAGSSPVPLLVVLVVDDTDARVGLVRGARAALDTLGGAGAGPIHLAVVQHPGLAVPPMDTRTVDRALAAALGAEVLLTAASTAGAASPGAASPAAAERPLPTIALAPDAFAAGDALHAAITAGEELSDAQSAEAGPPVVAALRPTFPRRRDRGAVVLFTGLSGSGKSTVAEAVRARLLTATGRPVTLLDGDLVRRHLSAGLGFSREDRDRNVTRIGFVAAELARHGGLALCAPIAPYDAVRREVRRMVTATGAGFLLVHVATPLEVCEARDPKGLYARARRGQLTGMTGIDDPYEPPTDAEVVLDTTSTSLTEATDRVVTALRAGGWWGLDDLAE